MDERVVVILGAGASAEFGGPLIHRFLDRSAEVLQPDEQFRTLPLLSVVNNTQKALRDVQSQVQLDVDNIEDVLSAIETGKILNRSLVGEIDPSLLLALFREVIAITVERSVKLPHTNSGGFVDTGNGATMPPQCNLRTLIERLSTKFGQSNIDFISFNYDLSLESAMLRSQIYPAYSESAVPKRFNTLMTIAKLHGSTNWFQDASGEAWLDPMEVIESQENIQYTREESGRMAVNGRVNTSSGPNFTSNEFHREQVIRNWDRLIVAPSLIKSFESNLIRNAWQLAAKMLHKATKLIFIGYSWPKTDAAFRHLLGLALNDGEIKTDVIFVRPTIDEDFETVRNHYDSMLGPSLIGRRNLEPYKLGEWVQGVTQLGLPLNSPWEW